MRVLGVDPGLTRCGVGVVERGPGRELRLVAVGVLRTAPDQPPEERLLAIATGIDEWVADHGVEVVAVERVFAQHNVSSVMGTAQVAGLAMVAAARAGLPLALHTPSEVKAAVTGSGRAEKAQVQEMVRRILGLAERPQPADAADALALAICQLWRGAGLAAVAAGGTGTATAAQRAWAAAEQAARRTATPRRRG
ncbi:crossover junction endodeoxyribonuclease RuvC [Georgenia sunbinii]|uniref:crossover junction endodeoxyribonuclease RuvC n=1 Tax=Georgenia sunbinii TaxID=3117728 RepID=UPI002F266FAA